MQACLQGWALVTNWEGVHVRETWLGGGHAGGTSQEGRMAGAPRCKMVVNLGKAHVGSLNGSRCLCRMGLLAHNG